MTVKKEVAPASKAVEAEFFRGGQDISLLFVGGRTNAFYTNEFLQIWNNEFLKIQVNLRILRIRNNEFYLSTPMPNEFHQNRTKNSYILGLNHKKSKPWARISLGSRAELG